DARAARVHGVEERGLPGTVRQSPGARLLDAPQAAGRWPDRHSRRGTASGGIAGDTGALRPGRARRHRGQGNPGRAIGPKSGLRRRAGHLAYADDRIRHPKDRPDARLTINSKKGTMFKKYMLPTPVWSLSADELAD